MITFREYLKEKMMFRGLTQKYNPKHTSHIEWYSEDELLAKEYAGLNKDAEIIKKDLPDSIFERSFNHGFRTATTEINSKTFIERIKRGILEAFENGWINREKALLLFDKTRELELPNEYNKVYEWWSKYPVFSIILKEAGYNSIHNMEQNINTYGIFK